MNQYHTGFHVVRGSAHISGPHHSFAAANAACLWWIQARRQSGPAFCAAPDIPFRVVEVRPAVAQQAVTTPQRRCESHPDRDTAGPEYSICTECLLA
jgi:hypothetical protein